MHNQSKRTKAELLQELEALQQRIRKLEKKDGKHRKTEVQLRTSVKGALKEGEQRYRMLAEVSFAGILISENGIIVDLNDQLAELSGYQREELLGQSVMILVAPESHEDAARAIQANRLEPYEITALRKDGSVFPVEVRARMTRVKDRTLRFSVVQDISDRKHMESVLRASENKFATAFLTSPDSININQLEDGLYLEINQGFTELTGFTRDDVAGKTSLEINIWANPEDRAKLIAGLKKDGEVKNLEAPFRLKSGAVKVGLMSAKIIDINGRRCILSVTRDISDRKKIEQELRSHEEKLRLLTDNMVDIISQIDSDRNFIYVSPSLKRVFGYEPNEILGKPAFELIHPDDIEPALTKVLETRKRGETSLLLRYRWRHANGSYLWVESATRLLNDEQGRPFGAIFGTRDITERELAEQKIQALHNELLLAYDETLEGWSRALNLRDPNTDGHSKRVVDMTVRLAKAVGIPESEIIHVRRGAILHDIGKMGIPDHILLKPEPLTDKEWQTMRLHPVFAYNMLANIPFLKPALDIPYYHHEKWDGSGYPRGLKGADIPLAARAFTIIDTLDALTSDRSYRLAWERATALDYIRARSGSWFDPEIVEMFFDTIV
jgi:PAS domain S-box-containing protein